MRRLLIAVMLLVFTAPLNSTVIIFEENTGEFLDFVTRPNKVEGCMRARIIPGWYGEADGVKVICKSETSGLGLLVSKGDSIVIYNYEEELKKVGLVEILSDSLARIIVKSKSFKLKLNTETAAFDSVLVDGKTIPIETKKLK